MIGCYENSILGGLRTDGPRAEFLTNCGKNKGEASPVERASLAESLQFTDNLTTIYSRKVTRLMSALITRICLGLIQGRRKRIGCKLLVFRKKRRKESKIDEERKIRQLRVKGSFHFQYPFFGKKY